MIIYFYVYSPSLLLNKVLTIFLSLLILVSNPVIAEETIPSDLEIEVHYLINEERDRNGLTPLYFHSLLIDVAREHSQDMLDNNYFEHENLAGEQVWDRAERNGLSSYTRIAENLYFASRVPLSSIAERAVEGWIDSPGHYENMLSATTYTGIGVATIGDTYYITQVFVESTEANMGNAGTIYENNWEVSDGSGFKFTQNNAILAFIGFFVILKLMDNYGKAKRNNQYRRRRR